MSFNHIMNRCPPFYFWWLCAANYLHLLSSNACNSLHIAIDGWDLIDEIHSLLVFHFASVLGVPSHMPLCWWTLPTWWMKLGHVLLHAKEDDGRDWKGLVKTRCWGRAVKRSICTALPDTGFEFLGVHVELGVGLSDPYGSLPTQDTLWGGVTSVLEIELLVKKESFCLVQKNIWYGCSDGSPVSWILLVLSELIKESSPFSEAECEAMVCITEGSALGGGVFPCSWTCLLACISCMTECCFCIPEVWEKPKRPVCCTALACAGLFLILFPEGHFCVSGRQRNPKLSCAVKQKHLLWCHLFIYVRSSILKEKIIIKQLHPEVLQSILAQQV